jgi:hypothetical protein
MSTPAGPSQAWKSTVVTEGCNEVGLRVMLAPEQHRWMHNVSGYLCLLCGSLVIDFAAHERWHMVNEASKGSS